MMRSGYAAYAGIERTCVIRESESGGLLDHPPARMMSRTAMRE